MARGQKRFYEFLMGLLKEGEQVMGHFAARL